MGDLALTIGAGIVVLVTLEIMKPLMAALTSELIEFNGNPMSSASPVCGDPLLFPATFDHRSRHNFIVASAAFDTSVSLWPKEQIEFRQGARVIHASKNRVNL